jgi:protoporphyrin/coproporphyrin ferrochelatase
MTTGIIMLNFGEPETVTRAAVSAFLERIFLSNARLDPSSDPDAVRERARAMAERRAAGLSDDYRRMGGSPLNAQTVRQAEELEAAIRDLGRVATVRVGMQFTEPSIPTAAAAALKDGVEGIIALPVYPVSGPSTTAAALLDLRQSLDRLGWSGPVEEITDWHRHSAYVALRADGVRAYCASHGVALDDPATWVVFAAHGTPIRYLEEGSSYDLDVQDHCGLLAAALGVHRYALGFQNHPNRPGVMWTQPDIDHALERLDGDRIVVVPVSFMQEHSETLVDLDIELKGTAQRLGLEFHRVPVPHDDPRFIRLLSDLVEPLLGEA